MKKARVIIALTISAALLAGFAAAAAPDEILSGLTGKSVEDIKGAMKDGKDLKTQASEAGVSEAFKSGLFADMTDRLDEMVADGKITAEEAEKRLTEMQQRYDEDGFPMMGRGFGKMEPPEGFEPPEGMEFPNGARRFGVQVNPEQVLADLTGKSVEDIRSAAKDGKDLKTQAIEAGVGDAFKEKYFSTVKARLDAAVAEGSIPSDEAESLYAQLKERVDEDGFPIGRGFGKTEPPEGFEERGLRVNTGASPIDLLADLTGKTADEIREACKDGKSLTDYASEAGVLDAFKAKLYEQHKEMLDELVAEGRLTAEQAEEMLSKMESAIEDGNIGGRMKGGFAGENDAPFEEMRGRGQTQAGGFKSKSSTDAVAA